MFIKQGNTAALVLRLMGLAESTYYDRKKRRSLSPKADQGGVEDPSQATPLTSLGKRLVTRRSRNGCWN